MHDAVLWLPDRRLALGVIEFVDSARLGARGITKPPRGITLPPHGIQSCHRVCPIVVAAHVSGR